MQLHDHGIPPLAEVMKLQVPSSYDYLPKPRLPLAKRVEEVAALRKSIIGKAGLRPGTYSRLSDGLYDQVEAVYHGLTDHLLISISGLDAVELCRRLYEWQEELIGNIQKFKHHSIPEISLYESTAPTAKRMRLWEGISPWTESIRWLIEITVKYCESPGITPGNAKMEYLIELARAAFEWDATWENIARGLIPYELTVHPNLSVTSSPTARGLRAVEAFRKALNRHQVLVDREWVEFNQPSEEEVTLEDAVEIPEFKTLDEPLEAERGYRMIDWLRFSWALIDSFGPTQYLKGVGLSKLSKQMASKWGIPPGPFENLLTDCALSKEALSDFSLRTVPPMEYSRRDSRLLRRPVVLLPFRDKHICLYGVEVLSAGSKLFVEELTKGKIKFAITKDKGPLGRAIGKIQTNLGHAFRDMIAAQCTNLGLQIRKEKDQAQAERIPYEGFGPVDVFVVDRKFHRFILVEVKDTSSSATIPKLMENEREKYLRDIEALNKQTKWFADRVEHLKAEYDIDRASSYSVEGVIVINKPRLWIYAHDSPLPIVDDGVFITALKRGTALLTYPV